MYSVTRTYLLEKPVELEDTIDNKYVCEQIIDKIDMKFVCPNCGAILNTEEVSECYRDFYKNGTLSYLCKDCKRKDKS